MKNRYAIFLGAILGLGAAYSGALEARELSDKDISQILIKQSIAAYRGSCPCP